MLDPQDASTLSVLRRAVLVLLASVLLPILPQAAAQLSSSSMKGTVVDSTGAVVRR